ncbi:FG-GAP-like repeat-containing protein [Micromonospora sp. WMMD812]|uniref:FG-GAP-like repeat-containing protein n=1 Tax=Micromonospora sp. WMMD812 TaxID=3015152 RepID=UPI00248AECBB|nr:FG-GAP-like repeat-containing protein [Micromonospora sp. WMMD812]WBB65442.1 FG-GAP-like repeat-containing protein [Micromonospora sp. WMMD812]
MGVRIHRRPRRRALAVGLAAIVMVGVAGSVPANAVSGGTPVTDPAFAFVAKVTFGDVHACTGALVAPQWVLTARSCVTDDGQPPVAGAPARPTTVTVGRLDLTAADGRVSTATRVVPHPDRNLALLRLVVPVAGVAPVGVATAAPAPGEPLQALGFGRTATEWAPDKLHAAPVTVEEVTATTVGITNLDPGGITTCKGDSGGPAVRVVDGRLELVAVHHTSWQGGCLAETETRRGAVETRVDDLAGWVRASTPSTCNAAGGIAGTGAQAGVVLANDFTGDCKDDLLGQVADGRLRLYGSSGNMSGTSALLPSPWPYVGTNWTAANRPRVITGDFTGDGRADLIGQTVDGTLTAWESTGDVSADYRLFGGRTAVVGTGFTASSIPRIIPGDYNGDGRTDVLAQLADGTLKIWPSTGDLSASGRLLAGGNWIVGNGFTTSAVPRIFPGDFDGDGRTDLVAQYADGSMKAYPSSGDLSANLKLFPSTDAAKVVGSGWRSSSIPRVAPADVDGDGRTDLIAQLSDGRLRAYQSSGATSGGGSLFPSPYPYVGTNWTTTSRFRIIVGDMTGDWRTDIIGNNADGALLGFASTGDLSADYRLFGGDQATVGSGWTSSSVQRIF